MCIGKAIKGCNIKGQLANIHIKPILTPSHAIICSYVYVLIIILSNRNRSAPYILA